MKKIIYSLLIMLALLSIASCSLDDIMTNMGSNVLGNVVYDVEVKTEDKTLEEIKKENGNLGAVLDSLVTNLPGDAKVDSIVAPVDSITKEQVSQNLQSEEGKKKLEAMKGEKANPTDKEKEAIKGTATIVDSYLGKIPTDESGAINTGNAEVDKLVSSMKDSFDKLAKNPEEASKGDVLGLQYTVDLLDSVANAIPADKPIEITVKDPVTQEEKTKKVSSETLLNTLFQNKDESNPDKAPLTNDEIKALTESQQGKEAVADLVKSAQDYVNVVGSATNFTGGVDVGKLLGSFLGTSSNQGNGGNAQ